MAKEKKYLSPEERTKILLEFWLAQYGTLPLNEQLIHLSDLLLMAFREIESQSGKGKKISPDQVGALKMNQVARVIQEALPGLGFALFVFQFNVVGVANYISNANRESMITALEETLSRFKKKQTVDTPNEN